MALKSAIRAPSARYLEKRELVLTRAAQVFNSMGVRGATLADVAAAVELNLTSLRHYYVKKEDLVAAAFARSIETHMVLVEEAKGAPTPETRLRALVKNYFAFRKRVRLGEEPDVIQFGDLRAMGEPVAAEIWPLYAGMFRTVRELIAEPEERRSDRPRINARTHTLISQLFYSVFWLLDYAAEDFDRVEARFSDLLVNGLAAPGFDVCSRLAQAPLDEGAYRTGRDGLLLAATQLINDQGYRGASVEAIAARLNVTKGSFYHHLDGKDDLIVACFNRSFSMLTAAQRAAVERETRGLDQAASAVAALVHGQFTEAGPLLRNSALNSVEPEMRAKMLAAVNSVGLRYGDMVADGIIDGSVRPCDPRVAAAMLNVIAHSSVELATWIPDLTAEMAARLYVRPMFKGLFA